MKIIFNIIYSIRQYNIRKLSKGERWAKGDRALENYYYDIFFKKKKLYTFKMY